VRQTRPHAGAGRGRRRRGRGPHLCTAPARSRPPRGRAGPRPPARDDLQRGRGPLVPPPRPPAGQGHGLGHGGLRRVRAAGGRGRGWCRDAEGHRAPAAADSRSLLDRRGPDPRAGRAATAVRRRLVLRHSGHRHAALPRVAVRAGPRCGRHHHPDGARPAPRGAAGRELLRARLARPRRRHHDASSAGTGCGRRAVRPRRVVARRGETDRGGPDIRHPAHRRRRPRRDGRRRRLEPDAVTRGRRRHPAAGDGPGPGRREGTHPPAQGRAQAGATGGPGRACGRRHPLLRPRRGRRHPVVGMRRRGLRLVET